MARSFRIEERARRLGVAALATTVLVVSQVSCAKVATLADVVFPASVPGLPSGQTWSSFPLRSWLTEPGIEPVAISACTAADCREPAVVGLFRARGQDAAVLRRVAADPGRLAASLLRPRRSFRRSGGPRAIPARIRAMRADEGGMPGIVIRLARPNGSRPATGYAALVERAGVTDVLIVVAVTEPGAREIARSVIPRLRR